MTKFFVVGNQFRGPLLEIWDFANIMRSVFIVSERSKVTRFHITVVKYTGFLILFQSNSSTALRHFVYTYYDISYLTIHFCRERKSVYRNVKHSHILIVSPDWVSSTVERVIWKKIVCLFVGVRFKGQKNIDDQMSVSKVQRSNIKERAHITIFR